MSAEQQALQEAAEAFAEAFSQYGASVSMEEYGRGLSAIAPSLRQVSEGITTMAGRMRDEDPVEDVVIEGVEDVGANLYSAADVAEELEATFEQAHERELERIRNPRRGEQRWDVTQQDGQ